MLDAYSRVISSGKPGGSTLLILSFLLGLYMLDAYSRVGRTQVV